MKPKSSFTSSLRIFLVAFLVSFFVFAVSLVIQWLVYDDWLHRTGPMRVVGTCIAAVVTFSFVLRWQRAERDRQRQIAQRFEMIAEMNDRVRNALQAIECVTYVSQPETTEAVRRAVATIDETLRGVSADFIEIRMQPQAKTGNTSTATARKSA